MASDSVECEFTLDVEVLCDLTCPWCYFALKHLDVAKNRHAETRKCDMNVFFTPFCLFPDLDAAVGAESVTPCMKVADVMNAAVDAKVKLNNDRKLYRTEPAHAATKHLMTKDATLGLPFLLELLRMYFEDGENITDPQVLAKAALAAGAISNDAAETEAFKAAVVDVQTHARITELAKDARRKGYGRVPRFSCQRRGARRIITFEGALSEAIFDDVVDELE